MIVTLEIQFDPFVDIETILAGAAVEGSDKVIEKIDELMNQPKSGNLYKHKDGAIRPASNEGEAPGLNSKDLVGSFEAIAGSTLDANIESSQEYGMILEDKRDRPFTYPAVELAMPELIDLIEGKFEERWH